MNNADTIGDEYSDGLDKPIKGGARINAAALDLVNSKSEEAIIRSKLLEEEQDRQSVELNRLALKYKFILYSLSVLLGGFLLYKLNAFGIGALFDFLKGLFFSAK